MVRNPSFASANSKKVAFDRLGLKPSFILTGAGVSPHTLPTPMNDIGEEIDSWAAKTYDWLLSRDIRCVATKRLDYSEDGIYPSDHYPVMAKYDLARSGPGHGMEE